MRFEPTDPERFSKTAAGVQSWLTAFAIVIGGVWVLYTFWALGATNKARAEIAELEQRAVEQPVLSTAITATVLEGTPTPMRLLSLAVALKNDGKRALQFKDSVIQVVKLSADGKGITLEGKGTRVGAALISGPDTLTAMPPRLLRSGQARTLAFLVPVTSAGIYLVEFRATYKGIKLIDGKFVEAPDEPIDAVEQSIVNVPDSEAPKPPNQPLQRTPQERRR